LLVEQIDNASNLEALKLWPPLLFCLSFEEPQLRRYAAWVIGTAVQNNSKAQNHLLQYHGVKKLVEKLDDEYQVRTKVLYALGSELSHCPAAMAQFNQAGGWEKLRMQIEDVMEGSECQRRTAFFISNYLAGEDCSTREIEEHRFLNGFVNILENEKHSNDTDLIEKVVFL
jgi:hsp70-interacting protein